LGAGYFYVSRLKMHLSFRTLWRDTDGMLSMLVQFERGDGWSASQEVYIYPEALCEFGRKLAEFPSSVAEEVLLCAGSEDEDGYSQLRVRAFAHDAAGHTALQVFLRSNPSPQFVARADVTVPVEAAQLNELGAKLARWNWDSEEEFEYACRNAG
jgi:hypothetical protein